MDELIADTTLEDVGESCRPLVELIGLENVLKLSAYSMGDKIYFPKVERLIAPARNRRIRKEYNGFNIKELAILSRSRFLTMTVLKIPKKTPQMLGI